MLIAQSLGEISLEKSWVAIGAFDGVHRGHQALLADIVRGAHAAGQTAAVVTFHPHPRKVLHGRADAFYLTLPSERTALLAELGIDVVVILQFDTALAAVSAADFVRALVHSLGMVKLCVGHDFALGNRREGDIHRLRELGREYGYEVVEVQSIEENSRAISSSQIRQAILAGNVVHASRMLGRLYQISGQVVPGDQRGRSVGIPTANIRIPEEKLVPLLGVYACRAIVNDHPYAAAVNIGTRPTFTKPGSSIFIEAHLLDYSGDLYGEVVTLHFEQRLRSEMRFDSVELLVAQVQIDIQKTREILGI